MALFLLGACATLPGADDERVLAELAVARGVPVATAADPRADELAARLAQAPLALDDALSLALLHNPRVREEYARLGLAGADVYEAGRLSNPRLSAARLGSDAAADSSQVSFGLVQSFTDILLLPARRRLARGEYERVRLLAGERLFALAVDVEVAWTQAVASRQLRGLREAIAAAARASADLAQRFHDAGNLAPTELALARAAAAEAAEQALRARAEHEAAGAALGALLGIESPTGTWQLPAELPKPIATAESPAALLARARDTRLDLAALAREQATLEDALATARGFRYLGAVDIGVETERETDRSRLTGPSLALELPLFDHGAGKIARAQSALELAAARRASLELALAQDIEVWVAREAIAAARAEMLARELVPAREALVEQVGRQVNFMLEGPFRLLEVKRQAYDAWQAYIEAVRDFWLARAELGRAVGARLPPPVAADGASTHPAPAAPVSPAPAHHHHAAEPAP